MTYSKKEALGRLFKPGKIKILNKIDKSQPLTNTEIMYYYRSIRPFIIATQNIELLNYLRRVDSTKKLKLPNS
jgi:hypothetical protein